MNIVKKYMHVDKKTNEKKFITLNASNEVMVVKDENYKLTNLKFPDDFYANEWIELEIWEDEPITKD